MDLVCLLFDVVHISLFLPWRSGIYDCIKLRLVLVSERLSMASIVNVLSRATVRWRGMTYSRLLTMNNSGFIYLKIGSTTRRVSSAMAIVNLFVRPISAFLLYKVWKERKSQHQNGISTIGGDVATFSQQKKGFGTIFSSGSNSPPRKSYQEIPSVAAWARLEAKGIQHDLTRAGRHHF